MRRVNAFEDGCFQCGRFVELLPFENAQGLTDHIAFVGITTGVDETVHKLVQRGRKGDCHGETIVRSRILSRSGLRWFYFPLARIVSKDTGFDALVDLLKSRHVKVKRHLDWSVLNFQSPARPAAVLVSEAPAASKPAAAPKVPVTPTLTSGAKKLIENLRKLPKPKRPKKEKSLIAHAKPLCGKDVSEAAVVKVLGELRKAKFIAVDVKGAVSYNISEEIK